MLITTGADVAEETHAFNQTLAETLAALPAHYEVNDPVASRAARARGEGPFPAPVLLDVGQERAIPGRAGQIPLRVFVPPVVRGVHLHIHGGGWTFGSASDQDALLWRLAQAAEVAVVSVDYRLAPEHPYPAAPDDCEDAARWLVANAQNEFGADRLTVGGESAGAHLAAVTLLRLGGRGFRAAQLTFGAFDLSMTPSQRLWGELNLALSTPVMAWFYDQFLPGTGAEARRAPDVSPLYADLSGLPPARFVVGTRDPLLDDTLFMESRWRAAGNETALEVIAEAPHGFLSFPLTVAERELAAQAEYLAKAVAD
ncbi:alpha/beta hydrolase [Actinoallomurus iriomotensis]|uniref:Esterase n=1 Tax=Actinoallomurus iriomotensis TaxID=478107 RepID=A0A9W6S4M8_9ACTN|nr:alpha/beta hydrolase [Actinoallomurus iriomotensis]GLY87073.1 esterase [Actinoallomurus iriomotensis]